MLVLKLLPLLLVTVLPTRAQPAKCEKKEFAETQAKYQQCAAAKIASISKALEVREVQSEHCGHDNQQKVMTQEEVFITTLHLLIALKHFDICCISARLQKSNPCSTVFRASTSWRDIASCAIQSDKLPLLQNLPRKKCTFLTRIEP